MLPTKGYFQDIECPYFDNACGRPYCHFRHRKKQLEIADECSNEETISKDVPTYKPTPKSELAVSRSHIPISYVPDIIYRTEKSIRSTSTPKTTFMSKPTYKPTPISLLTSAVKNNGINVDIQVVTEIKENIAKTEYVPKAENNPEIEYKPTALEDKVISENLEKHEYKPIGKSLSEVSYNPTALEDINENSSCDAYKPMSDNVPSLDYKPSCLQESANIDFGNLDREFDMIDEIINMTDKVKSSEIENTQNLENKLFGDTDIKIKSSKLTGDSKFSNKNQKTSSKSHKHSSKDSRSNSKRNDDENKKSHRKSNIDEKNNDDKKHESKGKKTSHKTDGHEENKCSSREENKCSSREENKCSSREDIKKSIREDVSDKEKRSKYKDKEKSKKHKEKIKVKDNKEKERSKNKDETRKIEGEDRKKVKEKEKKRNREKVDKYEKKTKDKTKYNKLDPSKDVIKELNEEREKNINILEDLDFQRDLQQIDKNKYKNLGKEDVKFSLKNSESREDNKANFDNLDYDADINLDNDETMRECYRIFNEYDPAQNEQSYIPDNNTEELKYKMKEELLPTKKRIAHSNAPSTSSKFQHSKPNTVLTPGQIMSNRYKIVKTMQCNNEESLIRNELKLPTKRAATGPSLQEIPKKSKLIKLSNSVKHTSLIDDIINGNKNKQLKKIAPVTNVMNIQRAKAQLEELNKKKAASQLIKTVAQSSKGGKRQAHIPEYSLNDIPDVLDADKSKLPVNVRTRFLTLLADECCKLYVSQKDAFKRALDEEYSCYQKCKVLVTYRNSAMLAVNRIRKEVQEREENDLDLLGSLESSKKINENSVLRVLYNQITQYLLNEEELDIHGYPRESEIPGRAIIKNRKSLTSIPLPKNQRKCSRCCKIYLVHKDGKVVYEEECLYHPLKKRTIRGEQIYLCCKSSDDSGCATSHTHVSEMSEDAELEGFQITMPPDNENDPRNCAVYALDCEMCYTTKGLELTRVTIVDTNCKTVYESLVKPLNEIIDYNTRFSGITKEQMDRINTGILQVQANILHLCNSKTILIGHSLESDMKALKIVHGSIIDTSVLFPHKMGLPHKRALRTLASDYLKKIIQNDVSGHDSAEDAITCMELLKWKVKEDSKFKCSK
ncbi:hypothetical protein WA026_012878 [Henosepilachna vigintioctopunctata]|uniref:Exonuclease domain-containing protein n=1 Tax=Henosepilachna vigintioctopunctata TaxID=420089 RepID=A0AAW1TT64_9CUCU